MKKLLIILQSELKEYLSAKGFVFFTLLIAVLGSGLLFLPRFIDLSGFTGVQIVEKKSDGGEEKEDKKEKLYILDAYEIAEVKVLEEYFPKMQWVVAKEQAEVELAVMSQEAEAGFIITAPDTYEYYVYNKVLDDDTKETFEEAMKEFYRQYYCRENHLDYEALEQLYDKEIVVNEQILNKDTRTSYVYCIIFVYVIFFMILLYGQMIAVSITTEKSNRAMEVLVTSTTPNSLLFGKVIAGAVGGLLQCSVVIGSILISYQLNRAQWGGRLDMFLQIPSKVLITFALFGLGGYFFYAFLYGAVGAMVSKIEDVSKSSGGLMMLIMIVFWISFSQVENMDGILGKVLSFLPISSYSTMFLRIAVGTVETWEVIVSFMILLVSIVAAGFIGAKIYRLGTLRYGNPIKLKTALKGIKLMREEENVAE